MKTKLTSLTLAAACLALLCAMPVSLRAATLTVTNTADSGPGTLRDALAGAANGDTIAFGVSGTITLTSGQLNVSNSVTILGPGIGALAVSGNNASGVFNVTGTNVAISGLTIANGSANNGAGIYAGGGSGSVLTVSGCVITNNSATSTGGGICNSAGVTITVSNCTISGNSAPNAGGGGIYNQNGALTVVASTLSGNSANGSSGGGIFSDGSSSGSAALTINASTFNGNSANTGGGICNYTTSGNATLEIGDTILNAGAAGGNIYNSVNGRVTSDGYNLCSDAAGGNGATDPSGYLNSIGDIRNTDPKLGPLQNNGGPTWTHALLAGSPAIDKGKTNAVPALARATDQRGLPRPMDNPNLANASGGDGSDIGAFEVQIVNTDSGPGSLRAALAGTTNGAIIDATGVSGTITLTNGQLNVSNSVTILGPGPGLLTVSGNNATGVFNVIGTNVAISGLTIANGQSDGNGAGIYAGGGPGSVLAVSGCVITNNSAGGNGGGIYNSPGVTLTLSNCTVSGNSALNGSGGGIYNGGVLTVIASTLSGNSAAYAGGGIINNGYSGSATLKINASTISGNSALYGNGGGGIYNWGTAGSATLTINASTFSDNSAGSGVGGSIYNTFATLEIANTILNAGASGANLYNYSATINSDGYNLASDGAGGVLTKATDQINTDPMLGPLQDNGGPTWTHALLAGSPAMDKGKTNAIPALARATDQRGLTRPVDFACIPNAIGGDGSDIGAYESQDSNANGLPDDWEMACFGNLNQSATGDPDGDGQNNMFEFLAGTNPTNPASAFSLRAATVAGQPNQRNLIFSPWASSRIYTPQFTANLNVAFVPLTGYGGPTTNGAEVTITDLNATEGQKFYRIQISLP